MDRAGLGPGGGRLGFAGIVQITGGPGGDRPLGRWHLSGCRFNFKVDEFINQRYASYTNDLGQRIMTGETGFDELEDWVLKNGEPHPISGRQEYLENLINSYL